MPREKPQSSLTWETGIKPLQDRRVAPVTTHMDVRYNPARLTSNDINCHGEGGGEALGKEVAEQWPKTGAQISSCKPHKSRRGITETYSKHRGKCGTITGHQSKLYTGFHNDRTDRAVGSLPVSVLWPNGQRDHTRGICHVVTEGHFKGLCVYAWVYACPIWEEDGKTGWESYKSMMCCCRRISGCAHRRQQSFSRMLIYFTSAEHLSTAIHTLKIRLCTLFWIFS